MKLRIYRAVLGVALCLLACEKNAPKSDSPPISRRIVVMAPAAAEILDALGATSQLVGVGDFVQWPPEAARLPKVGAYHAPNVELVVSLGVDLLLTTSMQAGGPTHAKLRELGVQVVSLETNTYEGVLSSLRKVGTLLGKEEIAAQVEARIRSQLEETGKRAANAPRRRVLFVVGREPLYAAGPGSHVDEMIRAVGGENVVAEGVSGYQLLSMEIALESRPDVIVDTSDNRPGAIRGRAVGFWGQFPFLPAVKSGRVYYVEPVRLVIPGMRLPEMTALLGKIVQPEIFGEADTAELGPLNLAGGSGGR